MTSRSEQFDELVLDVAARLEARVGEALREVEFAVEDVPPGEVESGTDTADVPLGRYFPAVRGEPPRIVVYRRPLETRAQDRRELAALVNDVVVEHVAALLHVDPGELDPDFSSDD